MPVRYQERAKPPSLTDFGADRSLRQQPSGSAMGQRSG